MRKKIGISIIVLSLVLAFSGMAAAGKATVKPYGFILLNTQYQSNDVVPFDIPAFAIGGGDGTFNMTARQSRFGVYFDSGMAVGDADIKGKIELDFWGLRSDSSTNHVSQTAPRLRLAYAMLDWGNTQFTFGQDWMRTFSPLCPTSLAHVSVPKLTYAGNLYTRVAQLRFDHKFETEGRTSFGISGALLRPMSADYDVNFTQVDEAGAGERSKMPHLQGRFAIHSEMGDDELKTGLGFHYGQLEGTIGDDLETYGIAWDGYFPFNPIVISAEFYWGKNLTMFYSSAGVANRHTEDAFEQEVRGGWIQVAGHVNDQVLLNFGYGIDDPEDGDVVANGAVTQNQSVYGNLIYSFTKKFKFAFETSYIETEYLGVPKEDNVSVDFALQYIFK